MDNRELEKITISYAALLSVTEVGLGSLLHAFHVPFTGQFLSLNQIAILSHATVASRCTTAPLSISTIAALLKSLSPIGKRVTPMLALAMQGLLFTLGIVIGGKGAFGRALGALFSSLWSFLQPLFIYSIIFGKNIWEALFFVNSKYLPEHLLITLFCVAVSLKIIAAVCTALFAPKAPLAFFEKISSSFKTKSDSITLSTNLKRSFKDLFRPSFLLLFALLAFLVINTLQESDAIALMLLRPIAVGFLVSMVLRHLPTEKIFLWFSQRHDSSFQRVLQATLETLAAKRTIE